MDTFQIELTPEAAKRLRDQAARNDTDPNQLAAKILDELLMRGSAEFDLQDDEVEAIQAEVDAVRAERSRRTA